MKHTVMLLSFAVAFSPDADNPFIFRDKVQFDSSEDWTVLRTVQWPNAAGGATEVEQRLQLKANGHLGYDYHAQSEATKAFHRSYCAEIGYEPSDGDMSFSPDAVGWGCSKDELLPDGIDQGQTPG